VFTFFSKKQELCLPNMKKMKVTQAFNNIQTLAMLIVVAVCVEHTFCLFVCLLFISSAQATIFVRFQLLADVVLQCCLTTAMGAEAKVYPDNADFPLGTCFNMPTKTPVTGYENSRRAVRAYETVKGNQRDLNEPKTTNP
jgi:hypothetical protein